MANHEPRQWNSLSLTSIEVSFVALIMDLRVEDPLAAEIDIH